MVEPTEFQFPDHNVESAPPWNGRKPSTPPGLLAPQLRAHRARKKTESSKEDFVFSPHGPVSAPESTPNSAPEAPTTTPQRVPSPSHSRRSQHPDMSQSWQPPTMSRVDSYNRSPHRPDVGSRKWRRRPNQVTSESQPKPGFVLSRPGEKKELRFDDATSLNSSTIASQWESVARSSVSKAYSNIRHQSPADATDTASLALALAGAAKAMTVESEELILSKIKVVLGGYMEFIEYRGSSRAVLDSVLNEMLTNIYRGNLEGRLLIAYVEESLNSTHHLGTVTFQRDLPSRLSIATACLLLQRLADHPDNPFQDIVRLVLDSVLAASYMPRALPEDTWERVKKHVEEHRHPFYEKEPYFHYVQRQEQEHENELKKLRDAATSTKQRLEAELKEAQDEAKRWKQKADYQQMQIDLDRSDLTAARALIATQQKELEVLKDRMTGSHQIYAKLREERWAKAHAKVLMHNDELNHQVERLAMLNADNEAKSAEEFWKAEAAKSGSDKCRRYAVHMSRKVANSIDSLEALNDEDRATMLQVLYDGQFLDAQAPACGRAMRKLLAPAQMFRLITMAHPHLTGKDGWARNVEDAEHRLAVVLKIQAWWRTLRGGAAKKPQKVDISSRAPKTTTAVARNPAEHELLKKLQELVRSSPGKVVNVMHRSVSAVERSMRQEIAEAIFPEGVAVEPPPQPSKAPKLVKVAQPTAPGPVNIEAVLKFIEEDPTDRLNRIWDAFPQELKNYLATHKELVMNALSKDSFLEYLKNHPELLQQLLSTSPDLLQQLAMMAGLNSNSETEKTDAAPAVTCAPGQICPTCGRLWPLDLAQTPPPMNLLDDGSWDEEVQVTKIQRKKTEVVTEMDPNAIPKELIMWHNAIVKIAASMKGKKGAAKGRIFPPRQLRGEIFKIYQDKAKADKASVGLESSLDGTDGVAAFATSYFHNKFGKKEIVQERLEMLVRTLWSPSEDPFVEDFAVMCGLRSDGEKYSPHLVATFLTCVERMFHYLMPRPQKVKDPIMCLEHPKACEIVAQSARATLFVDIHAKLVDFDEALEYTTTRNEQGQQVLLPVLPADRALCSLLQLLSQDDKERKAWLAKLFEDFVDSESGVINEAGFRRLVSAKAADESFDPSLWYTDACACMGVDIFDLDTFVNFSTLHRPHAGGSMMDFLKVEPELLQKVKVGSQEYVLDASQSRMKSTATTVKSAKTAIDAFRSEQQGITSQEGLSSTSTVAVPSNDTTMIPTGSQRRSPDLLMSPEPPNMSPTPGEMPADRISMRMSMSIGMSASPTSIDPRQRSPTRLLRGVATASTAAARRSTVGSSAASRAMEEAPTFSLGNSMMPNR